MRFRVLGAAALVAAAVLPQSSASAWQCYSTIHVPRVCALVSPHPEVCVFLGEEPTCKDVPIDICAWDDEGHQIFCLPIVWPPV